MTQSQEKKEREKNLEIVTPHVIMDPTLLETRALLWKWH
jgi:hypothetical protein